MMAWTAKHEPTALERKLSRLSCLVGAHKQRLDMWRQRTGQGHGIFPTTQEELTELGIMETDIQVLKEVETEMLSLSCPEWDTFFADLKRGMQRLSDRIRVDISLPFVPKEVRDSAFRLFTVEGGDPYDYDPDYAMDLYPGILNHVTAQALYRYSNNDSIFPHAMYAIGAYWVSERWSDAQLVHWFLTDGTLHTLQSCPALTHARGKLQAIRDPESIKLSPETYATLLAILTSSILHYDFEEAMHPSLIEQTIRLLIELPLSVLQREGQTAGVQICNNKACLIIALIEHIYNDVLEPRV